MTSKKLDMLHIFVTDECNMRCPHCYVDSSGRFSDELSTDEMISLFKELNQIQFADGVHIEGGEPFLRKDLTIILSALEDISHVTIATNGTINYRPDFKVINNVQRIGFSVEGATQETHEKLRPNNLEKLLHNMEQFMENGFSIQSRTTLTSQNYHEIKGIVATDYERGIPIARFQAFTPIGRGAANQELGMGLEDYIVALRNYMSAVMDYGSKVLIKFSMPTIVAANLDLSEISKISSIEKTYCFKECNQVAIAANGDVFQCYNLLNHLESKVGNIRKVHFLEIISSKSFKDKKICPDMFCASHEKGYTHIINLNYEK